MSPPLRRPSGVSAEDVVAVVRVHADRVHDAVRRLGCEAGVAAEVVDASALELVEAVAEQPHTVADAVGWWFARAREIAGRVAASAPDLPLGRGVLSADDDQIVLAEALEELPERERFALLLRDAYDLPTSTVAAALGTDPDEAFRLLGRARRAVVPLLDDEPGPAVPAHAPDLASLARLGEGGVLAARDATTHRHVLSCPGCRGVVESQQRVHLLFSGLTVVALGADDRADLLARTEEQAHRLLPSAVALAAPDDDEDVLDDDDRPLLPAWLAAVAVLVAVVLGTGIGVLLSRGPEAVLPIADDVLPAVTIEPVATPTPIRLTDVPPPPPPPPAPETSVFTIRPRTTAPVAPEPQVTATPAPEPTPTASATGPAEATLRVEPESGRNGERIEVTGEGWAPGARVVLTYLDPVGRDTGSRTTVRADRNGRFAAELRARNPENVPGRHQVQATDGTTTRTAPFDVRP